MVHFRTAPKKHLLFNVGAVMGMAYFYLKMFLETFLYRNSYTSLHAKIEYGSSFCLFSLKLKKKMNKNRAQYYVIKYAIYSHKTKDDLEFHKRHLKKNVVFERKLIISHSLIATIWALCLMTWNTQKNTQTKHKKPCEPKQELINRVG